MPEPKPEPLPEPEAHPRPDAGPEPEPLPIFTIGPVVSGKAELMSASRGFHITSSVFKCVTGGAAFSPPSRRAVRRLPKTAIAATTTGGRWRSSPGGARGFVGRRRSLSSGAARRCVGTASFRRSRAPDIMEAEIDPPTTAPAPAPSSSLLWSSFVGRGACWGWVRRSPLANTRGVGRKRSWRSRRWPHRPQSDGQRQGQLRV